MIIEITWEIFKEKVALISFVENEYESYYDLLISDSGVVWNCKVIKTEPRNNAQIEYETSFRQLAGKVFSL